MYVRVRATPGAKKEKCEKQSDIEFSIAIKEPAERNLANRRIQEVLALHFHIPVQNVHIVSGHRSPQKIFDITI